jgi:hypothetical protein
MIQVAPYLFGISVDIRGRNSLPFSKERLDKVMSRLLDTENGLALRSDQIRLRATDLAFDYELKATLLSGNGFFVHDAEKFYLGVSGGRNQADARLLAETAKRFLWVGETSDKDWGLLSVNTHAKAASAEDRDRFLNTFKTDKRIVGPAALAYVSEEGWADHVRFGVEPSLGVTDSLFLTWNTQFRGNAWLSTVDNLTAMLGSVATVFGIEFKPIDQ